MKEFDGNVAVVTGAASGIGRALARRCAAEGMRLLLAGVEVHALMAVDEEMRSGVSRAIAVPTDVRDSAHVEELAA